MTIELVNDEDDVMLALAVNLAKLIDHVGGSSKAMHLIGLLEELCVVEEGTVRKQAASSISQILSVTDPREHESDLVAMIKRLANGDWFTSHMSAALLTPSVYPYVSGAGQRDVFAAFMKAVEHENNSVRKVAAEQLNLLIQKIPDAPEGELLSIFSSL